MPLLAQQKRATSCFPHLPLSRARLGFPADVHALLFDGAGGLFRPLGLSLALSLSLFLASLGRLVALLGAQVVLPVRRGRVGGVCGRNVGVVFFPPPLLFAFAFVVRLLLPGGAYYAPLPGRNAAVELLPASSGSGCDLKWRNR